MACRERCHADWHVVESQTADMARLGSWASNIFNAGSSWEDPVRAERVAVGEAIERYCGNVVDYSSLVRASYQDLCRRGIAAIDPRSLVLFSNEQYAMPGFPFVPFATDLVVSWTLARSLVSGEQVLAPASLVYVNWNTGQSLFDPPTNPAYYPGIAAAPDRDAALCNAIEEVGLVVRSAAGRGGSRVVGRRPGRARQRVTISSVRYPPAPAIDHVELVGGRPIHDRYRWRGRTCSLNRVPAGPGARP